jgi:myosin heavy subunit
MLMIYHFAALWGMNFDCGVWCVVLTMAHNVYNLLFFSTHRKTETTKIIMAFLAKVSSLNRKRDSLGTIQCNVLEANTILDAIGNARTMRNDNSSRFGKYVKLHFDNEGELIGAGLDTFLLETTRVVRRNQDEERNFHIFYLLCSESDPKQREELKLQSPETYSYLNSSGIYDRRDGVKDSDMLDQLKASLKMLNIEPDDLQSLLKCFVAILTIGNVKFSSHTTTAGTVEIKVEEGTEQYLTAVAELLEISPDNLLQSFTTRNMVVVGDEVLVTLTDVQAEELRDVFAKTLYSVIFAWLIEFF